MVGLDNWETQEGYICQGNVIGFIELGTAVVAGEALQFDTPLAQKVIMKSKVDAAGACAVALKGGGTGDKIPACFYGVVKMVAYSTITNPGEYVINSKTEGTTITYGNVMPLTAVDTTAQGLYLCHVNGTGTAHVLGMALQAGTTVGDELLILIGACH